MLNKITERNSNTLPIRNFLVISNEFNFINKREYNAGYSKKRIIGIMNFNLTYSQDFRLQKPSIPGKDAYKKEF